MPYYSVRITGGSKCDAESFNVRNTFNGIAPDFTGGTNLFYVQRDYNIEKLRNNVEGMVSEKCSVEIDEISESQYFWKKNL